jgi:hypothetical protein
MAVGDYLRGSFSLSLPLAGCRCRGELNPLSTTHNIYKIVLHRPRRSSAPEIRTPPHPFKHRFWLTTVGRNILQLIVKIIKSVHLMFGCNRTWRWSDEEYVDIFVRGVAALMVGLAWCRVEGSLFYLCTRDSVYTEFCVILCTQNSVYTDLCVHRILCRSYVCWESTVDSFSRGERKASQCLSHARYLTTLTYVYRIRIR